MFTEEMGLFLKIMTYCAVQIEVHSFTKGQSVVDTIFTS